MKLFNQAVWCFLLLGLLLRCGSLNRPLLDAHLLRQTQTADATRSLIAQPGFPLSARIPWQGDLDTRYVQEPPIYNYLAIALYKLGLSLDLAGKLVSLGLWGLSFVLLQGLWRRCLPPAAVSWANLLFVIGPLEVFYGQAFMPEMLIQCLSLGFLLGALRYFENPTARRWLVCAATGLLAVLLKLPATLHLWLLIAFLLVQQEGWKAALRLRYVLTAILCAALMLAWSRYVEAVNAPNLSEWTPHNSLLLFLGTPLDRLKYKLWAVLGLYLVVFVVPGVAAVVAAVGLSAGRRQSCCRFLFLWLGSLAIFYLLWFGNTGARQGYYNLVAVGPLCGLFGVGVSALLNLERLRSRPAFWRAAIACAVIACAIPGTLYLFRQDRQLYEAARWTRDHVPQGEVVLFRPNHRFDMLDYPQNAVMAYYSEHPTFLWAGQTSEPLRQTALNRARYALVTLPTAPPQGLLGLFRRFRGDTARPVDSLAWLGTNGFRLDFVKTTSFALYRKALPL